MDVTGRTKIFRKDFDGRPSYSRAISSQEYKDGHKGDWITEYEIVQFPKGTQIPDRSIVEIKGFEAVYKSRDGVKRKLVVTKYNLLDEGFTSITTDDVPF